MNNTTQSPTPAASGLELPELPSVKHGLPYTATDYYTADQMHAYARHALAAQPAPAAKPCVCSTEEGAICVTQYGPECLYGRQPVGIDTSWKVLLEHSGCGYGKQANQLTVSLDRGDKIVQIPAVAFRAAAQQPAPGVGGDDIEIAEAALNRALLRFTERQHVDPSTGYGEYNDRDEEYHADLVSALDAVKGLHDVPPDRRNEDFDHE